MTLKEFQSHAGAFGEAVPNTTPHAVSVSLPTLRDVELLFRDEDPEAWSGLETIYPRFGDHPLIKRAISHVETDAERTTVALSSAAAAERLIEHVPAGYISKPEVIERNTMAFLSFTSFDERAVGFVRNSMKRAGLTASSRRAEDFLRAQEGTFRPHEEVIYQRATEQTLEEELHIIYAPARPDVVMANSGMTAALAAVEAVHAIRNVDTRKGKERDTWLQIGQLYHDTTDLILDKQPAVKLRVLRDGKNLEALTEIIETLGDRIAGVITEAPTNPLIDVPEIEKIKELLGEIPLVVDVTTAGSINVDVLPYADIVIESMTKFASGQGDVMMGAIVLNREGDHYHGLKDVLPKITEGPYIRDVQRLAYEMTTWRSRAAQAGRNAIQLAEFFEAHKSVKRIYWSGSETSLGAYEAIARQPLNHTGVMTIETTTKPAMASAYDRLDLSKGPSFGTQFTLNTPYVHITHPHETVGLERRMLAKRTGLNPRMLRVSVGTEDPEWLKARYDEALKA